LPLLELKLIRVIELSKAFEIYELAESNDLETRVIDMINASI